jgi:8-oxo-dGTP pyrophosphatase MutT (NUDIX family)
LQQLPDELQPLIASNTGALTRLMPTLDIDILNPEAAEALARERFEERGFVLVRIGKPPKRAIPFRTDEPFDKITGNVIAPNGDQQKIEFLCDGQQVVVDGIHPETGKPYAWHGGTLGVIKHDELPYIRADEAHQLAAAIVALLVDKHGYQRKEERKRSTGAATVNSGQSNGRTDWSQFFDNLIDHDQLTAFAMALLRSGMNDGATVNFLRDAVADLQNVDEARRQRRLDEIPGMVSSARAKLGVSPEPLPDATRPGPRSRWIWEGETRVEEARKWLVANLLPETGVALISGQWGSFKTFIALDLAGAVMTGGVFIKYPVMRRGGVLLFACEGQNEVAIRIRAAYEARGGEGRAPFAWQETSPRLLDGGATAELVTMIKEAAHKMQRDFGLPVALVIVDTAGKAAGYSKAGEENDAALAKIIMRTLGVVALQTNTLVTAVAHFGKHVETGTRGSSSYEDDADVVLAALAEKTMAGAVTNTRLAARKRRSGINGEEYPFRTKTNDMGVDLTGITLNTLTIEWLDEAAAAPHAKDKPDAWSKRSLRLLRQALMNVLVDHGKETKPWAEGPTVRAVDIEIIRGQFYKGYPAAEGTDAKSKTAARRQAFHRAITDAKAANLIGTWEIGDITYVWLTDPTPPL